MSNGFAMAAVIGRADIMAPAAESFISTSYHTERVGPAAALAAIKKMRSHNTIEHNCATGRAIKQSATPIFRFLRKSNSALSGRSESRMCCRRGWAEAAERTGIEVPT